MNFEPFILIDLELVSIRRLHMMSVQTSLLGYKNVLHVYLQLSSSPGMTISCRCHDAKRGGGGGVEGVQDLTS